ncbi:TPA: hypothetical protein DD712_00005 [Candidatus Acetothermia bacterium]|nr:hypothetical protein [Candidatus Acetothermia bacterium]
MSEERCSLFSVFYSLFTIYYFYSLFSDLCLSVSTCPVQFPAFAGTCLLHGVRGSRPALYNDYTGAGVGVRRTLNGSWSIYCGEIEVAQFMITKQVHETALVIFDKDGTLISYDHWGEIMHHRSKRLAHRLNLSAAAEEQLCLFMGVTPYTSAILPGGLVYAPRQEAEKKVGEYIHIHFGLSQKEAFQLTTDVFSEIDQETDFKLSLQPLPGAVSLMENLRVAGAKIAIATHDSAAATQIHLHSLGWTELIDMVVSPDIVPEQKPSPQPILRICSALDIAPEQTTMVGDNVTDVLAGKNAGCKISIGVLTGVSNAEEFSGADLIIKTLDEVLVV